MAHRSSLDPDRFHADGEPETSGGLDSHLLGPSDSSDTIADSIDEESADTSDREHTGERLTVEQEPDIQADADIGFDRIVGAEEAGLGGGLDQAEEAQLGITDEELAERLAGRIKK